MASFLSCLTYSKRGTPEVLVGSGGCPTVSSEISGKWAVTPRCEPGGLLNLFHSNGLEKFLSEPNTCYKNLPEAAGGSWGAEEVKPPEAYYPKWEHRPFPTHLPPCFFVNKVTWAGTVPWDEPEIQTLGFHPPKSLGDSDTLSHTHFAIWGKRHCYSGTLQH